MKQTITNSAIKNRKNRTPRLFFTGITMGMADLVPGVSGGTIAFLLGIYDELLFTVKQLTGAVPGLVLKGKFKEAISLIPFGFILPLGIGILSAIFGLVQVITYLLENHAVLVWSLFFGLVVGSAIVVARRVPKWNLNRTGLLLLGFILTFALLGLPVMAAGTSGLALFATGAVAISAMILPGISGSLIMVMLGQYESVINAVADRNIALLVWFAAGAVVGLALFARLLSWLLHTYHAAVVAFLVGVMLGSLRKVWPWQEQVSEKMYDNVLPELGWGLFFGVLLAVIGVAVVWRLEKLGIAKEHIDIESPDYKEEITTRHD